MENQKLLNELEHKFKEIKADLGFKTNLDELERIFLIKDYILKEGFVAENLYRQISSRIMEMYFAWNDYLHSLIMPNPQNILNMSESKVLNQDEKKEIGDLMKKMMELMSRNSLIGLTDEKKEKGRFIDDALRLWKDECEKKIEKIIIKINKEWAK